MASRHFVHKIWYIDEFGSDRKTTVLKNVFNYHQFTISRKKKNLLVDLTEEPSSEVSTVIDTDMITSSRAVSRIFVI